MKIMSSYGIEIKNMNKIFYPTIAVYNKAVSFCISTFESEWTDIKNLDNLQKKSYAEKLIHSTKNNTAKYNFDSMFYKMPTYMRRAAINAALGYLNSYHSLVKLWQDNGCIGKKPSLQINHNSFPTFYRDNMYVPNGDGTVQLKLYINNDWKWINVSLKHTDLQYIYKHLQNATYVEKEYHSEYSHT